ncbi:unnamed protein product, partial [Mesorhabditis spiculigera]
MRGCFLLLLTVSACYSQIPTVITKYGPIQGTTYIVQEQQKVYEFLGVPFAEPPLGNLRFEKPQTPRPWTTPYNATSYPLACVQCVKPSWAISEDCLRLNIWTPSLTGQQLPVVVYIHGGAYQSGTGQQNAKAIREVYAVSGIVFISIQYRLGWMGNSKQVTIWGTSAGSSSVGQHTISPKSRGLFSQAYEQSGSPIAAFARGPFVIQATRTVLLKLGCPTQGDIKKCLQSKTIDQFYAVTGKCLPNDVDIVEYSPLFDGDFFTEDVEAAIKSSPALPTLVGLNQVEGRLFVLSNLFAFSIPAAEYQYMTADALYDLIETWISNRGYSGEAESAAKTIYNFYSQGYTNSSDHKFWVEQYVKLWTDTFFNAPAMREAIAKTNARHFLKYNFSFRQMQRFTPIVLIITTKQPGQWIALVKAQLTYLKCHIALD